MVKYFGKNRGYTMDMKFKAFILTDVSVKAMYVYCINFKSS